MIATFIVVLPIFALIFAGWATSKIGVLGPHATSELNRFVVYLALPALLFDIMANTKPSQLWQPGFIAVFALSSFAVFLLPFLIRLRGKLHLADAALDGLNASYPNTGYMGFPLTMMAFGASALVPTTIATIFTVCVIFALTIVLIEVSQHSQQNPLAVFRKVGGSLIRNPLLISPALGALVSFTGIGIAEPVQKFLTLLGAAASPCALVALGLFLAQSKRISKESIKITGFLVSLKLIIHPLIAWLLAVYIFDLSPQLTHTAVLIAALPTGTGPFMLAEFYRRDAAVTSNVILVSTVISVLTVSAYLALIH